MMDIDLLRMAVNCGVYPSVAGCVEIKTDLGRFLGKGTFSVQAVL